MREKNITYFDLIKNTLPKEISINDLIEIVPHNLFINDHRAAAEYALRNSLLIDWNTYLQKNQDVFNAKIDPCTHFLRDGLFEGRKLYYLPKYKRVIAKIGNDCPKISIIIPNYNAGIYLRKCLDSVVNQSLKDIEIIIIDDNSNDNSVNIIEQYIKLDKRIKFIKHVTNQSQHMARKHGVEIATGEYIMFVDSDDFLKNDACAIALKNILHGYDMVAFNRQFVYLSPYQQEDGINYEKWLNSAEEKDYSGDELKKKIFYDNKMEYLLTAKIFDAKLIKYVFSIIDDGYYIRDEDLYIFLIIVNILKRSKKVNEIIYFYHYGTGVSNVKSSYKKIKSMCDRGQILLPIKKYLESTNDLVILENIKKILLNTSYNALIPIGSDELTISFFNSIFKQYGILYSITLLLEKYFEKWNIISKDINIFCEYKLRNKINKGIAPKNIGIFYHRIAPGGVERVIKTQCDLLIQNGFNVMLFVEEKHPHDLFIDKRVKLIYINSSEYYKLDDIKSHLKSFYCELINNNIDLMLYHASYSKALLWDIFLIQALDIGIITTFHGCFSFDLIYKAKKYDYETKLNVFRCSSKTLCISKYSELFLRSYEIDAEYIGNPVHLNENFILKSNKPNNIIVCGRLGDRLKRIPNSIWVLKEVIKQYPETIMYFVGDFINEEAKKTFNYHVDFYNLKNNIVLTGWIENPQVYMDKCKVLLSTSYTESFSMVIGEALSRGIPCVIYKLPIEFSNSESVISVPQGDYKSAAEEIISLFENDILYNELSEKAIAYIKKYSNSVYSKRLIDIISSYYRLSIWDKTNVADYYKIIKSLVFYGSKEAPDN